tara:strand:+ start:30 stop:1814 length:1785 start_codon:yes stop_codon:yes gene_type:complete
MKVSKRQLKLIIENFLLSEHNKNQFEILLSNGSITENDYDQIFKRGQPKGIFKNNMLRQVLYNTILKQQGHAADDFIANFNDFKNKIISPFNSKQLAPRHNDVSAKAKARQKIYDLLVNGSATYNDFQEYIEFREKRESGGSNRLQIVIDEGFAGNTSHFENVYEDNNWIICYPKTYQGSIATARMGPDKKYYTPPEVIGRLSWCTAIDSGNNMFLNYHRSLNLHMYYFTKKAGFNPDSPDRKLCLSFVKQDSNVKLYEGNATVNGDNRSIDKTQVINIIGAELLEYLRQDVIKPHNSSHAERKQISRKEYYASVTAEQFKTLRVAAEGMDASDFELFAREVREYAIYSQDKDLLMMIVNDDNPKIAEASEKIKLPEIRDLVTDKFINSPSPELRRNAARRPDLSEDHMWQLSKDEDDIARQRLAYRIDLPMNIKVELFYDNEKRISDTMRYDFESMSSFSMGPYESIIEDQVSELSQMAHFGIEHNEEEGYSEDNPAGSKIFKLTESLYESGDSFEMQREFERYLDHHKKVGPELDMQYTINIAEYGIKILKQLNDQKRDYYKFVMTGMAEQAGIPDHFLNISSDMLRSAGLI